jgi:hypothetical protein
MQATETNGLERELHGENSGSVEFSGGAKESRLLFRDKLVFLDLQLFNF